ncbi:MAG: 2Fe-2S iron-sulfur cluster binding domain-containing protein [Chloroflexi bacterium]|jgi:bidirectional [NiFe] hydrogenase diaphorase subunit|nr:2Fe-2S iron-sulfur cluster binding domain-containing protein [Chloroflexota bacterium]MBT7080703.1 2Fe-2S iron-sulfur cluster binding domain-containing protein [Chloroflexota bacterium]MBT7290273.1 2Fe-2S iron-sulfur cluster binding domain-containing protein [Chloroflexota bacterium]
MVKITIDGRQVDAEDEQTILSVAQREGIEIPTLCKHEAVKPLGTCRVCMVEVVQDGKSRSVASCIFKAKEGMEVKTDSDVAKEARINAVQTLLERAPNSQVVQDMATRLGVQDVSTTSTSTEKCIQCTLCVRICEDIVGVSAIAMVKTENGRKVAANPKNKTLTCIGCGSCAYACPTGNIEMIDADGIRTIKNWDGKFEIAKCKTCGNYLAPQVQLDHIKNTYGIDVDVAVCRSCSA